MIRKYLRLLILIISVLTILSGLVQMVQPRLVLSFIQGDTAAAPAHFFGIVGMFMFLFGGLMLHSLYGTYPEKIAVLWCGLQKAGAAIAVAIGIFKGLFSPVAGLVAGFDLLSAVIFFVYLNQKPLVREE